VGVDIWYSLVLPPPASFDDAVAKMRRLHEASHAAGFSGYGSISQSARSNSGRPRIITPNADLSKRRPVRSATNLYAFVPFVGLDSTRCPGRGTETADFSLCEYPEHVDRTPPLAPVRVGTPLGFSNTNGFCKTQYASRFGEEHFLPCHLALIRLLDVAPDHGIRKRASDAGQYWETRSEQVLLSNLRENNALVSVIVGNLKDQFESRGESTLQFTAPIMADPAFEHLEADGHRQLPGRPRKQRTKDLTTFPGQLRGIPLFVGVSLN
jgi:hypothetical protein